MDRDGIVIDDVSYPYKKEDLHIREEIIPHLKWAQAKGFKIVIVTNQSGIARGYFTLQQYRSFEALVNQALAERDVFVDAVYFCPFHEKGSVEPYNVESEERKPAPGMFFKARDDLNLSLEDSFMVGDKFSDNIDYPGLRSLILESPYTRGKSGLTYESFDLLFREIRNGI